MIETVIVINNYLHDVATAMLFSTGCLMIVLYSSLLKNPTKDRLEFYRTVYGKYTLVAKVSLVWILAGGIPRFVFYKRIEWSIALNNGIIPALVVKHIILFTLVIAGAVMWKRLSLRE